MTLDDLLRLEQQMSPRPWTLDATPLMPRSSADPAYGGVDHRGIAASRNVLRELVECATILQDLNRLAWHGPVPTPTTISNMSSDALARLAARLEEMGANGL